MAHVWLVIPAKAGSSEERGEIADCGIEDLNRSGEYVNRRKSKYVAATTSFTTR